MYLITIYLLKKQTDYAESTCSSNLEFNDESVSPNKMSFTSPEENDSRNQEDTTPQQTPFTGPNGPRRNGNSDDKLRSVEQTGNNHAIKEKTEGKVKVDLTIPEELLDKEGIAINKGSDGCVSDKQNDNDDLPTESELTSIPDLVPQEANTAGETNEFRTFLYDTYSGLPVVRGPDCIGGESGRDESIVGTVTTLENNCEVRVTCDDGTRSTCRAGKDGRYDLRVFDSGPVDRNDPIQGYDKHKLETEDVSLSHDSESDSSEEQGRNNTSEQQLIMIGSNTVNFYEKFEVHDESVSSNKMSLTPREESDSRNQKDTIPQQTPFTDSEIIYDRRCPRGTQGNDNSDDKLRSIEKTEINHTIKEKSDSESDSSEEQGRNFTSEQHIRMIGSNTVNFHEIGGLERSIHMEGDTNLTIQYNMYSTPDREMNRSNESGRIRTRLDIEENPPATDAAFSVSNLVRMLEELFKDMDALLEKLEKGSIVLQIRPLSQNSVQKLLNSINNGDFDLTITKLLSHESVFKHIRGKNVVVKVDFTIPEELLAKEGIAVNNKLQFIHFDAGSDVCVSVKQNDNDDLSTESELTSSQEANTGEANEPRRFLYKTSSGLRVVGGESGRDESLVGTVTTLENKCEVRVTWDDGTKSTCRAGRDGRYDLRVFDSGPVGIRHKGVTCNGCKTKDFFGTRWTCKQCKCTNLCFLCYSGDKHDLDHVFRRHDVPGDTGIEVNKRRTSQKIQSIGQFPGAKVMRGEDWKWGQQDGGEGKTGYIESEVESRENFTSTRNVVRVKWDNGLSNIYRAGHDGRMDLKCIQTAPGPCYYKEHMPLLDVSDMKKDSSNDTKLVPGCKVCIHLEEQELKHIQNQKGEWSAGLVECIGRTGVILSCPSDDVANVGFGSNQYNIARIALSKVHEHSEQDVVRIMTNKKKVEFLQREHGGWTDKMEMVLGKVGRVVKVDKDGDVVVVFGSIKWFFNAACCIPAPGERVYDPKMETPDAAGVHHQLQQVKGQLAELVKTLKVKVKPNPKDIHMSVLIGDVASVKSILKENPNKVNERLGGDFTPLGIACCVGHNKVVNILLEHGADMESEVIPGATALVFSIIGEKEDVVKTLIDYGANMNVTLDKGQPVLGIVVSMKLWKTLRLFIDNGSDVNALNALKDTPLHDAITIRSDECIEVLLECPDLNLRLYNCRNVNQLQFATLRNYVFAVEKIIEKDKSLVDLLMADGSFCALHIAAAHDHVECARLLIEKGNATVDRKGKGGLTALHVAAATNNCRMIELLLDKGADVNHCDDLGDTPLHHLFFVSAMKKYEQGIFGEEESITEAALLLLEKQADITLKNMSGLTQLDLCLSEKVKREVSNFLNENNGSFKSKGRADTFPKPSPFRFKTDEQNLLSNLIMSSPPFTHLTNSHLTTLADFELLSSAFDDYPMSKGNKSLDPHQPQPVSPSQYLYNNV